ncbi:MAG: hypothetical protein J1E34_00320 [Oscillospiraceae bacterium]|nr:hypothetical protein [Oscillospiraceae bacterium]
MKMKRLLCLFLVLLLALPACGKTKAPSDPSSDGDSPDSEPSYSEIPEVKSDISVYQQSFIADIVRPVSSADVARNKEYVVSDDKVETIISLIDGAINSPDLENLIGVNIGETVKSLISGVYSDSLINTIVSFLYPLVANEFTKVWAGLPKDMSIKGVDTGVAVVPKANVNATLDIQPIEYSLKQIDFYIFPSTLAEILPEQYSEAAEKLRLAVTPSLYDKENDVITSPWDDAVLFNENGDLDLNWGVTDRESFIDAASAALKGLEPLLLAILCNKAVDNHGIIGSGDGYAAVIFDILKLDMKITAIELVLTCTANSGYNNTVAPIFEALGLTAPDGDSFSSVRDIVERGLIIPIENLLDTMLKAPVSFILSALPNIAYAIEGGLVSPLLSMLKTDIAYTANAEYTVQIAGDGRMDGAYKADKPIKIDVGEMLDLESMGIDLSSLNGLLSFVAEKLNFTLPPIEGAKLATLGEVTWHDTVRNDWTYTGVQNSQAAYIKANKADVLLFLLDYVFNLLGSDGIKDALLGAIGDSEAVSSIINNVLSNPNTVIAAVTELLVPQSYTSSAGINWKSVSPSGSAASMLYTPFWTEAKADYMLNNLSSLIDNILSLVGLEIAGVKAGSLSELIDGLLASVVTADTLNNLAKTISDAISGLGLSSTITDLLKNMLGIDLGYWNSFSASFADGDRDAFAKSVANMISPIQSLLDFLLLGQDIAVSLSTAEGGSNELIRLHGSNAYSTAIIPLLEAFGITNIPSISEMKADSKRLIPFVVDSVFGVLDEVKADPINKLFGVLPNLLYFIYSGGLTSTVNNLLFSVDVLLDVIRPIYDINISSLIDFDIRFEKTDVMTLLSGLISDLLRDKLGIDIAINLTTAQVFNALVSGETESFTSANGRTAYRINEQTVNKRDMLTVIYDVLLNELLFSDNTPKYLNFAKEKLGLSDSIFGYIEKIVPALKEADENYPGSGKALIFWIFFAAESITGAIGSSDSSVTGIITALVGSGSPEKCAFARSELFNDITNEGFANILFGILKPLFSK